MDKNRVMQSVIKQQIARSKTQKLDEEAQAEDASQKAADGGRPQTAGGPAPPMRRTQTFKLKKSKISNFCSVEFFFFEQKIYLVKTIS
jgi:hypothetical protein